jgi:hypothetical protein
MTPCGAKSRSGGACRRPAGWGTNHVGYGRCKLHGGNTRNHQQAARRQQAAEAVASLRLRRDVDPTTALLEEVHRAAGHVAWLGEMVGQLDEQHVVHGVVRTVQHPDGSRTVEARAGVNVWVRLYQGERDRLVRAAKVAIDAGVAEHEVRITEQQAAQLAQVITAILSDLGHDLTDEHVRNVVRLRLLGGVGEE